MAINVTCPGCLKRFQVADQHAGKKGPCPNCKKIIEIPKAEDAVVIHAPTHGPKDAQGREVLKTFKRRDAVFDPLVATGVGVVVLLTLLAAFLLRGSDPANDWPVLAGGSILLGPLLAWAGYAFLRDSELEPYTGVALWLRATATGLVFALCWFLYFYLADQLGVSEWRVEGLEMWQAGVAAAIAIGIGTFASVVALDLEPMMAFLNCGFYFVVTVLLRWIMQLPPLPGLMTDA
ncbi:hypothetical protein [Botrimarina sp.]|uniref:hypothetical protein n=1 Tax=Botrimarina sp. TaxID=2795802 RepID=UPI0032ED63B6